MEKKVIFIDIDGTLFDHDTSSIPKSAIQAIHKAHENGHILILCTGRSKPELEEQYRQLPFSGYILSCGAQIIVDDQVIYSSSFPQDELQRLTKFMLSHNIGFSLDGKERSYLSEYTYHIFSTVIFASPENNSELSRAFLTQNKMFPFHTMKPEDYEQIVKISLFSPEFDACYEMMKTLPDNLHGFLHPSKHSKIMNGEISQKKINKATGMDILLDYFNMDLSTTMAIGDSLNDLEMIEHAHIGICMGNGVEELKIKSDFVTKPILEDGLEFALKHFHILD